MPLTDQSKIGLANRFAVKVTGGEDLGSWTKAEGLEVEWEVSDYRAGDGGNERLLAPAHTKYVGVKLTRAASAEDTPKVKKWLDGNSWGHQIAAEVKITLFDSFGTEVHSWDLKNALPKKWQISSFDASTGNVAIETLEIDHNGFLDDERKLTA